MRFNDFLFCDSGKFLIVGCGATLKEYKKKVVEFAKDCVTIGINNMQDILIPKYNLWTNNGRLKEYGDQISKESIIFLGSHIKKKNIDKYRFEYCKIDYTDFDEPYGFDSDGTVHGFFRTAGCLAIYIAKLMGADEIYLAGFDGYTLMWGGDQHLYGSGMTDRNTKEVCQEKDQIINDVMKKIYEIMPFKIITPTVYKSFYDGGIL